MKKFSKLFLSAAAGMMMFSCSSDEPANNDTNNVGEARYMAVSIATSQENAPMGRAEGDSKDYEHGETFESAVKTLDFYFFDADGKPANVKSDGTNHLSVSPEATNTPEGENITNAIKAVLVISTKANDAIPEQIVAVVNKEPSALYGGMSIEELQDALTEGRSNSNGFVMTNSVYVAGNALQIGAHIAGHLFSDQEEAMENPVTIYVERTLAKVRVQSGIDEVDLTDGTKAYDPKDTKGYDVVEGEGDDATTTNKKLYVKFLGWNTTCTSENNRLIKQIEATWNPGWTWNTADYHRSFWAVNAPNNTYNFFKFNAGEGDDATLVANSFTNFKGEQYTYLKENAGINLGGGNPTEENASKVIIAAQLVDGDGKPVEFAEWAFQRMTKDDLKKAFADALPLYYKNVVEDETNPGVSTTIFTKIDPSEIELKTATAAGFLDDNDNRRYLVYGTLTAEAAEKTWYGESHLNATPLTTEQIEKAFLGLGGAKVWTNGYTYYYFNIRHLAAGMANAQFGQTGVVRNHVYDATVATLKGLGTPVYDPYEVIIPEKPSDDDSFIAAEIKVLSWRIVNFNVDLNW